jgi:ribosomal-protein-alanine N-acetyltransferase
VIGSFDFKNTNPRCGQLDYALGSDHWSQGIITEAAVAVRDWAFENLPDMIRLQAFCVEENVGSSRVMEKIGMVREGIRRKAFILKGMPVNLVDYSIVR